VPSCDILIRVKNSPRLGIVGVLPRLCEADPATPYGWYVERQHPRDLAHKGRESFDCSIKLVKKKRKIILVNGLNDTKFTLEPLTNYTNCAHMNFLSFLFSFL